MRRTAVAVGGFIVFVLLGSAWVGLGRFLPDGVPRSTVVVVLAVAFVCVFVWNIVTRIRVLLRGDASLWREVTLALINLALLLLAFATVYQKLGIIDNTTPDAPVTRAFWSCLYYSVVTFTTLGYGDFYPRGIGRFLAALEALTGYLVLGVLASTAATLLSPREGPAYFDEDAAGGEG